MSEMKNYIIRTGELEDAEAVFDVQNSVISEGEYFITVSEEFNKTPEQQRDWIRRLLENERETIIAAEINGEVIGWIGFQSENRKRMSHKGSFGMMIRKDYRGKGIGEELIKALLEWAEANPFIEKVSLGVFSTNQRAISLYKKMGFVEEGRKIKEFKMSEREYVDDIIMYKMV
ncbi:GNAT family N-acetyltransferase [Peribacillus sp. YIM B13472]|jgi:RimJ/RimL family protein N-acetyltransferase|uniref:GNAT family N-acetyltransferase n=1 Tax=Peribacillus TaxID=2675229 RepID=UPI0024C157AB|nr:GNAT family N-acetyltransferase [Peribacillus simplex]MDR4924686.1 GNAT family N-acetyltransferase [Peribacillus simplex]WHX90571.1 GNAT family N-acetyltransferase [Peribacillus simplex]